VPGVLVRRDHLRELGELRISVTPRHISEYLVVGAVFLNDIYDMLDVLSQCAEQSSILGA
jgi:hypothetical protein